MALLLLLTGDVQLNPGPNTSADAGIEQLLTNEPGLVAGDRGSGGVGGDVLESMFYIQEHVGQQFHQTVFCGEHGLTSRRAAACYLATASDVSNQKIDGASTLSTNVCTNHFHLGDLGITPPVTLNTSFGIINNELLQRSESENLMTNFKKTKRHRPDRHKLKTLQTEAINKQKHYLFFQTVNHARVVWDPALKPKGIFGGHLNIRSLIPKLFII
ncbi:hypothetical protein GOODEAATRI_030422 [Goodea atripinnis]|uniref:Uncharacterized protein n=1 Tax=Goodea atripinnis TaxID=208336 RepID=A0ABV0Q2B3_9TELE